MGVTKVYNKITLREHPDLSPVADPSFSKGHSFIFPGDEIVMCTKLKAPTDFIGGTWVGVALQSVKCSIIAKKLNIFSNEFSREFAATRVFELDSFALNFDALNAPVVPWGVAGADGYAPNLNYTQDRNWQLPSGDFKRQIKIFTEHTNGTSVWDYNFWFPFIFREEYWLALAAADNDFYDPLQPQNGKNQKWLRYHDLSALPFGWKVYMRFEFNYTKIDPASRIMSGGALETIVSEYSLSNEQEGIQDYESNPDYDLLEIKTCEVAGTPSTNRFVFGYQNTQCFGYFKKQSPWEPGEKDNLDAVFRIRPFEGGDRLGSRASTKFAITPDVVWKGISDIIYDDTGDPIQTDTGLDLLTDADGSGVLISFDPGDDTEITVQAEIDYVKLAAIFPGVTRFTLYCRLYNSTPHLCEAESSS